MNDKKIKRILGWSFCGVIIICIIIFIGMAYFMSKKTEESVAELNEIYMSEMNKQIQQKFQSIVELRLQQVDGVIKRTPEDSVQYGQYMLKQLQTSAEVRQFSYLGFYTESGELQSIYGEDVKLVGKDDMDTLLQTGGNVIKRGIDENGEILLLLGKPAQYPLEDGSTSVLLVAGIPMEYLSDVLFLDNSETDVYSYIINEEGEFVIRSSGEFSGNYFQVIEEKSGKLEGKDGEDYVRKLKEVMEKEEEYSTEIMADGQKQYVACAPLSGKTTWYLITVMPDEVLSEPIVKMDNLRILVIISGMTLILVSMIAVFVLYYRLSQQQIRELDRVRKEAVHANRAKSDFLSNMSHDIRTPMNAIIGMTEIALKHKQDEDRVEECLKKIKLSSKHLLGLINDVLDMSKIESGKMAMNINQISLRETMDDIVNIVQPQVKTRNQYFDIYIYSILSENIYCDGTRLNQILLNLLSNALKYTPEGGRIDVHVYQEESPLGKEYVRTHFLVEDTGIGMSEEFQKNIFDTFTREDSEKVQKTDGTGLGMAITKAIIDILKGTIEVESELEKGSKFHVTLDLKRVEAEAEMVLPKWNVLVVDDNEQLCMSAADNLEELGAHADWTVDGREALAMIEERHKKDDDYHFVLIDWKMPKMDGLQTIREIQKRVGKNIPLFLISAYDWSDIEEEVKEADIEGFISKPLFKSTLYSRLIGYVEGNRNKPEEEKQSKEIDFTGKRILLAEDIDINWEIANEILSSFGFEVERAVNGKECVEKFETAEIGFYDVILMDLRMPVMDGYEATKAIRALERRDKQLPIIAMTANAFSSDIQECLNCGMDGHIAKPLDIQELIRTLQKFLED